MIFDSLQDVIKHTYSLGFIDLVKLRYDEESNSTVVEAMDPDRFVVIQGTLKAPIGGLTSTIGLSRMGVLDGYLKFSPFADKSAEVSIVTMQRGGEETPAEVLFESGKGHTSSYRFMAAALTEDQIKIPTFKGANWNVSIEPSKAALKDLTTMNNILGSYEKTFTVKTNNDKLELHIGSSADRTKLVFASGITGSLSQVHRYPLEQILSIMKLNDTSRSVKMNFSDQGAIKIDVDSGMGDYTYILPARN